MAAVMVVVVVVVAVVVVVVVSVIVHNQAGRTLGSQTICLSVSFPSAMLALSLGTCLQTLLKGPYNPNISSGLTWALSSSSLLLSPASFLK